MLENVGTTIGRWLIRRGIQARNQTRRLAILIYHRVLAAPDPMRDYDVDAATFRAQMAHIGRFFNVLPLSESAVRLSEGTLPAAAVSITFDDGYRDNATVALPILRELGLPATFFISSGYLNGGVMWNDAVIEWVRNLPDGDIDLTTHGVGIRSLNDAHARATLATDLLKSLKYLEYSRRISTVEKLTAGCAVPSGLMMQPEEVRLLSRSGMEIGGHTRTHPILARLPDEDARGEIEGGKADLEAIIGKPISMFAYPNGKPGTDYLDKHVEMVKKAGFTTAVSTCAKVAGRSSDRWQLPRFTPWDKTPWRYGLRLALQFRNSDV